MTLRSAIDDYKRRRDSAREFPGERRSVDGTFSGLDERLVYVSREGWHRDYSYPVSGLAGVERSRFGIETLDGRAWFDDIETTAQRYVGDTAMVETVHDGGRFTVTQTDLTVGALHYTHFEVEGEFPQTPSLQAFFDLTPEKQESRLGKLEHEDTVEVHHDRQHNFVTTSTGVDAVYGQLPEQFDELAAFSGAVTYPRSQAGGEKYEDALLNGTVVLDVPLDVEGGTASTTVVSLLVDTEDDARSDALDRVVAAAEEHGGRDSLASLARENAVAVPESVPRRDLAVADLRVLELLSAETGAHIAGPDMDPFYVYTGGYGYTWFRDDSEIARFLLEADDHLGVGLNEQLADIAAFYLDTQLDDGSWPHRVWAHNGNVAPGWAHARIEAGDDVDYQADQTGSVASFLGAYLRIGDPERADDVASTLARAVDSLDGTVEGDGLPIECQNAWENMTGRFVHTAATFLQGYASVARAPVGDALREQAREGAEAVYEGLEELWVPEAGIFALRERSDGTLDARLDSGSLALAEAHREYAAVGDIDDRRLERLCTHFENSLSGLHRETDAVSGLYRFEGDEWRRRVQDDEKVWTVSTAWGANACAQFGELLESLGDDRASEFYDRSRSLFAEVDDGGSLVLNNGYLPEQVFDDGTPDCATPLGWPHAIRIATVAQLDRLGQRKK